MWKCTSYGRNQHVWRAITSNTEHMSRSRGVDRGSGPLPPLENNLGDITVFKIFIWRGILSDIRSEIFFTVTHEWSPKTWFCTLLYTYKWYNVWTVCFLIQKVWSMNWGFLIPYHYPLKRGLRRLPVFAASLHKINFKQGTRDRKHDDVGSRNIK